MSAHPRILVSAIALNQPMSGALRQAVELWPRMAQLLAEVGGGLDLLVSSEGLPDSLDHRLPASVGRIQTNVPPHGPLARALREGRATKHVLASAKALDATYDLLHTGHLPAPGLDVPLTFMIHDLRDLAPQAPLWRKLAAAWLLPATFNRACAIITVSQTIRDEIEQHFPHLRDRLHIVRHGSSHLPVVARPKESRQTKSQSDRAPILFMGHLEPRRNPMLLVETLARHPDLPPIVFAGASKHGEDRRLHFRARELGVRSRLSFLGPVAEADLPHLYAVSGCLVIPSLIEGFGIPALEAQRARLPLAVAESGALPEVSAPGTPMFAVDDPNSCAAAIIKALRASKLQIDAAQAFADSFQWDQSAKTLLDIWMSQASKRAVHPRTPTTSK